MRHFLVPLLLILASCTGADVPSAPDRGLPVTGIAGPAVGDLTGPRVIAHLLLDGGLTLDGRPIDPERLVEEFAALAPKPDAGEKTNVPNPVTLVIRADRSTPWERVRELLRSTAGRQGVMNLLFCVRHAGDGEEGTFLVGLPDGLATNRSPAHYLRTTGRHTVPAPPEAILAALAEPRRGIHVDFHPETPLSYALGLLDVLSRDGYEEWSVALSWGRNGGSGPVVGMRLDGRPVPAAEGALPVPARSPEIAGIRLTNGNGAGQALHARLMDEFIVTVLDRGGRWEEVDALAPDLAVLAAARGEDGNWSRPGVSDVRATGMAVLAFLAAGRTHRSGEHRKTVREGLRWLKRHQAEDGRMAEDSVDHAIATWAMARAYAQTYSPLFTQSAQAALDALTDEGGPWAVLARAEGAKRDLSKDPDAADVKAALRTVLAKPIDDDDPRRLLARAAKWLF